MLHRSLDRFWSATGSPSPLCLLVWQRHRRTPIEHRLHLPFAIVGRDAPADLVLDHPQVCRRHAFVIPIGDRAYCLDLGSRSALAWDGRSRRSGWIDADHRVEIGPFRIGLPRSEPTEPLPEPSGPPFLLEPIDGAEPVREPFRIDRPFTTLGRAPGCDLRLSDLSIGRHHCILIRLGAELWVVDLLGHGAVEVDARVARWAPLTDGSQLQIGRSRFLVLREPAALPAPNRVRGRAPLALPHSLNPANLPALLPEILPAGSISTPPAPDGIRQADLDRLAEAMITPLLDQFTLMQQHLFDQYHQSMMEMVGMFTRLHEEQRGTIDKEMRRIRRLTREVRSLRKDLDRQHEAMTHARTHSDACDPSTRPIPLTALKGPEDRGTPEDYRAAQQRIIARMTELQEERQGRWRRLIDRLGQGLLKDDPSAESR